MNLKPITHEELKARLNEGTVQFAFKKIDGDLRTAVGTCVIENIPLEHHPKSDYVKPGVVTYYDISKHWWRNVSLTQEVFLAE